ncbi:AAA-domain-containing protein, partial [Amniculicola lignicola CBS 123094]
IAAPSARNNPKRPTLFIEVELSDSARDDAFLRTDEIRREVQRWLADNFRQLQVGQQVDTSSLTCSDAIRSFRIADHSRGSVDEVFHTLQENDLDIAVYCPFHGEDEEPPSTQEEDESPSPFTVMPLPHKSLSGMWESLIYSDDMPQCVLRVLTRMMKISKTPNLNPAVICWHNLVLLHGPPGSGKTTLAQALAQRLAIRLAHDFSATKLIEINSHALHSRFFGESSKLVGKMFEAISAISSDESLLTVVIIDEVETLAGSRENAARANECSDAIWSTNELLQGLDKLRRRRNVLFLCTSNFKDCMDAAFVDRCGIKQYVETPSVECAYEIFRSVVNELIKNDLVTFDPTGPEDDPDLCRIETADGETRPLPSDEELYLN